MNGFLDFITISLPTMLIAVANLLILCLILKKFLFKPVEKMLAQREAEVQGMYADAERERSEGERVHTEYQTQLDGIEDESRALAARAAEAAARERERLYASATEDIARRKREADRDLEMGRALALRAAQEEIADLSAAIAEQVLCREVDMAEHRGIVEEFLRDLKVAP